MNRSRVRADWSTIIALVFLCLPTAVLAAAPEVTNVVARQQDDSFDVDITYDVYDPDSDSLWITIIVSIDGGVTFSRPCIHVAGDAGPGILPGTGKHVAWEADKDVPGIQVANAVVRVQAVDTPPNPRIANWWRHYGGERQSFAPMDTIGFGTPLRLEWTGVAPALAGIPPEVIAVFDTVYPFDDGLLGYKWRIQGELGAYCVPALEDCWQPRRFDDSSGDSVSYFGQVLGLTIRNDGSDLIDPLGRLLPSGPVVLNVNAIDLHNNEILPQDQEFAFVVNYDPETIILNGESDWAHPEDPQVYPYYIRLNDPGKTPVPFQSGDRIPDRTYVVVKALGRDDPRDERIRTDFGIGLAGYVQGRRQSLSGGTFAFATESSALDTTPAWIPADPGGWYADTLGFLTGPRTTFTFNMQAVDEHGRRDGTPASLGFDVGYPPCVQCIEVLPKTTSISAYPGDLECQVPETGGNACFQDTASYVVTAGGVGNDDLQRIGAGYLAINKESGFTQIVADTTGLRRNNYLVAATLYSMSVLLHGRDDPLEAWSQPRWRALAWRYQVDYACDPFNQIKDGGGVDDIDRYTWSETTSTQLRVDAATGLWRMRVDIAVPTTLINGGSLAYWLGLFFDPNIGNGTDGAAADFVFRQSLRQLSEGTVRAIALDQSQCGTLPAYRPTRYNYFRAVRPSILNLPAGRTWRDCDLPTAPQVPGIKDGLDLSQGAMESRQDEDEENQPVTKHFRLHARIGTEIVDCNTPPPSLP